VRPDALPSVLEQIDELLASPASAEEPNVIAHIERTLTDGYAHALSLEAERLRLERRMAELAAASDDGNPKRNARELAEVSGELSRNGAQLERLRGTLSQLRLRATAARASAES
jgi:hypothetical protein